MLGHEEAKMSCLPVLVILGSTGSGKSRLAIELARKFCGEIISADSMQVYTGLDIVTAKVTTEERRMAPHHMLDIVEPSTNFTVLQFRDMVLPIIDDLLARKRLPIIVGGTNYYIESLLWKILIRNPGDAELFEQSSEESDCQAKEEGQEGSSSKKMKFDRLTMGKSNEVLHEKLKEVDPEMARRLHPNNRRRIIRSLEVFELHGVTHSEILKAQRNAGGCGLGGPLRHPNSILLWLRCDPKILHERLDSRVDAMLKAGLVQELLDFHQRYNEQRIKSHESPDYTKGVFQSIGFKEFHAYLTLPEEEKKSERGQALLKQAVEDLKMVTKRYAKKQNRWVMNRLIRRFDRQVPPIYTLDCTDLEQWDTRVLEPASAIVSAVLRGEKPEQRPFNENVEYGKNTDSSNEEVYYCEICERNFVGDHQWKAHINGVKHMKVVRRKKKLEAERLAKAAEKTETTEKTDATEITKVVKTGTTETTDVRLLTSH